MPEAKPNSPSTLRAGCAGLVLIGLVFFAVVAMNTRDMLWFWPVFNATPVEIIVHCYGTDVEIKPGEPAFEAVTRAVNDSLTGRKRWDETSMSDITYQEYQTSPSMMVLRLHYDPPATVHSQYAFFKDVNWLIIPLDARHANTNPVFARTGDFTDPGSYHIKSTAPILTVLQEQGICSKP